MITDPTRIAEILLGLPDVSLIGVLDSDGQPLVVTVETSALSSNCPNCGTRVVIKERRTTELVDLPAFGRPTRLRWNKRRLRCLNNACQTNTYTEDAPVIASSRLRLTTRASKWATKQVGKHGRPVQGVADELGCDWHTVNDAVVAYGEVLVNDPSRVSDVISLGLDESLFLREGKYRRQTWATSIVDSKDGYLLDVVPGRSGTEPIAWIEHRPRSWRENIQYGTMDLSGPYSKVFDVALPHVRKVADPFHLVRLANTRLDQCRRRVQNEIFGHRGLSGDPLYRCRKLLQMASERLEGPAHNKMVGLLRASDPRGDVMAAWRAKEAVRELYSHTNEALARTWIDELVISMSDKDYPEEVQSLGRTLLRWKEEIVAWHSSQVTNGPTEAMNNLIKRTKRVAFGFSNFRNFRVRALLYAGRVNWELLQYVRPY